MDGGAIDVTQMSSGRMESHSLDSRNPKQPGRFTFLESLFNLPKDSLLSKA